MKKQSLTHLETVEPPIVPIGTLFGQRIMLELKGHDLEERELNFVRAKAAITQVFAGDKRTEHLPTCHWTGRTTLECYCNV